MTELVIQNSIFIQLQKNGAFEIDSDSNIGKFICSRATFIDCINSNNSGGAISVRINSQKKIIFSCFRNCKTITEESGSGKDVGQAFFAENNNLICNYNVIFKCANEANRNYDPFSVLNANIKGLRNTQSLFFDRRIKVPCLHF